MLPPHNEIGTYLPNDCVVATGTGAAVGLLGVRAFTNGCLIEIHAGVSVTTRLGGLIKNNPERAMEVVVQSDISEVFPELLRIGVDSRDFRATNLINYERLRHEGVIPPDGEPTLVGLSGSVGSIQDEVIQFRQSFWLRVVPVAKFDLVVEWPAVDIEENRCQLDGDEIRKAGLRSTILL
jgi:hypothetical protein